MMRLRPIIATNGEILCCVPDTYDEAHVRRSLQALPPDGWTLGDVLDDRADAAWREVYREHAEACDRADPSEWPARPRRYISAAGNVVTTRPAKPAR